MGSSRGHKFLGSSRGHQGVTNSRGNLFHEVLDDGDRVITNPLREMSRQHRQPHRRPSLRSIEAEGHHAKAIHGVSKWDVRANSKRVVHFVYGSSPNQFRRQHLEDILGASVSPPSLLRLTRLPFLTVGSGAVRDREQGGVERRRSRRMLLEQRARAAEGTQIPRPASPARGVACLTRSDTRTLKTTATLPSLRVGTQPRRSHDAPTALMLRRIAARHLGLVQPPTRAPRCSKELETLDALDVPNIPAVQDDDVEDLPAPTRRP